MEKVPLHSAKYFFKEKSLLGCAKKVSAISDGFFQDQEGKFSKKSSNSVTISSSVSFLQLTHTQSHIILGSFQNI
jgi:hypothetical protein